MDKKRLCGRPSLRAAFALALACAMLFWVMTLSGGTARTALAAEVTTKVGAEFGPLCFYRAGQLNCITRAERTAPTPRTLLAALVDGPTPQERAQGIESALPVGTRLMDVQAQGATVTVCLALPSGYLDTEAGLLGTTTPRLDALTCEAIVEQMAHTLLPLGALNVHVLAENPAAPGTCRPLSTYLPPLTVPSKIPTTSAAPSLPRSQPPVDVAGRPHSPEFAEGQGALSGKTVYLSAGHGWQWNGVGWRTQRPPYPDASTSYVGPIIEDHNNAEVVNQYLARYLWNAGADVWTARERDMNTFEQVIDDDAPGLTTAGAWETLTTGGHGGRHLVAETALAATAAFTWHSDPLPADGQYALYVWYVPGPDRAPDAHYVVQHAGGSTALAVDQRHHGYTWRFVGRFPVRAGERMSVSLNNQAGCPGQVVVADAVRVGGGLFDDADLSRYGGPVQTEAPMGPGVPWWESATYYHVQRMGLDLDDFAYFNDVIARPLWARWEHQNTGDDAVYVSWHSNGYNGHNTTAWGTVSFIHNFQPTPGSAALRDAIHRELVNDARAGWDPDWRDLGQASKDLGELRELWDNDPANALPGALIEVAYHDHVTDTDALKDPRFALLSARAVYQGIVKYFGADLPLLPEPPTHLTVRNSGPGRLTLRWQPSPIDSAGLRGDAAEGYRVYTSHDGLGWDNGQTVVSTTHVLTGLQAHTLVFVRVTAFNAGGESFPTPVLGARVASPGEGLAQILVVDGFDRIDRHGTLIEDDPIEGLNARLWPEQINSFDYVIEHGHAISLPFDSAANEAVRDADLNLSLYRIVDWILGEESSVDHTFDAAEQAALATYLDEGAGLFVSGAEVGWDLVTLGHGPDFYRTYLGADMAGDDAGTYEAIPTTAGLFDGLGPLTFRDNYDVDAPDQLCPVGNSVAALHYASSAGGGAGSVAAVQYDAGNCRRVVYMGFPFETLSANQRAPVMDRVLRYLGQDGCLSTAPQTAITTPLSGAAFNIMPEFGGSAAGFNPIAQIKVQVGAPDGRYWDGRAWITSTRWLTALGTTHWHYPLPSTVPSGTTMIMPLTQGRYTLAAQAWDTTTLSDTTPAQSHFIYDTHAPPAPKLAWPTDDAFLAQAPASLAWWGAPDDGGATLVYRLELAGRRYTTTGVIQRVSGTLSLPLVVYTPTPRLALAPGANLWRVQALDAAGNQSPWSAGGRFVVERYLLYLPLTYKHGEIKEPSTSLIVNGDFETDAGWDMSTTGSPATYVSAPVHNGTRAGQARVPAGTAGYSSLAQTVVLPTQEPLMLTLWFYPVYPDDDQGDLQYISLEDQSGATHILWLARQNDCAWAMLELDLTPYRDQRVTLRFGVRNDGDDAPAALVIDDVRLAVSGQ